MSDTVKNLKELVESALREGYSYGHARGADEFGGNKNYISEDEAWRFSTSKRKLEEIK